MLEAPAVLQLVLNVADPGLLLPAPTETYAAEEPELAGLAQIADAELSPAEVVRALAHALVATVLELEEL